MSSSETLLQAVLNRISARMSQQLVDSAAEIASKAKEAPGKLSQEWSLLKEEIKEEIERLEKEELENSYKENLSPAQKKIKSLRAKVQQLTTKMEERN